MTPQEFVAKWKGVELSEPASSQEHFIDLCRLLQQPTPVEVDKTGDTYTFNKKVAVTTAASKGAKGDRGFVDVWWRGKFGWEYKRKGRYADLSDAYRQLCQYREDLDSPPLLVVCDIARTEIHTNFTGYGKKVHSLALDDLPKPGSLDLLRRAFQDPYSFRPDQTTVTVTRQVAESFAQIAKSLRSRGHDPHVTAHFLMKCMFCLFAEDVGLLPKDIFSNLALRCMHEAERFPALAAQLFSAMRTGGDYGNDRIAHFNGGLFDEAPPLKLEIDELDVLRRAGLHDWSAVEPHIFGTLFERSLDPNARAQIGAHYTGRDDIMLVVEPVIMAPLRREWSAVEAEVSALLARRGEATTAATKKKHDAAIEKLFLDFVHRLSSARILDPASGSGNFLYVALQCLLDLEKEVIASAAREEIGLGLIPQVRPTQLSGIDINPYAAELAQVVIWIGYLQWMRDNGFQSSRTPILEPLQTIECRDAILDFSDRARPVPASWPDADFIIGNPPFLGVKKLRGALGDTYVEALFATYDGLLPNFSDLCCYWFERARRKLASEAAPRVGLLATQGIRGGENRVVLDHIKRDGDIFMAWSDRDWVLDGANVHVAIVGFDVGAEKSRALDGAAVDSINADLTSGSDLTARKRLVANLAVGFVGDVKAGAFDVAGTVAKAWLDLPNPNGRSNAAVLRPWINGQDITARNRGRWIIDFGSEMDVVEAAQFEVPFEHVLKNVKPKRDKVKRKHYRELWWRHAEPCDKMRARIKGLSRFLVTPTTSKFRLFGWVSGDTLPDHQLIVFAREDDYFFGVVQSAVHERWARRAGTQLREAESGCRYTPTSCFETFPFPPLAGGIRPPATAATAAFARIAAAGAALADMRSRALVGAPLDAASTEAPVKVRSLTALYNAWPQWLANAHLALDRAVLAGYGWPESWAEGLQPRRDAKGAMSPSMGPTDPAVEQAMFRALLALNLEEAAQPR